MPEAPNIADAALLALAAPPGGPLAPTDDGTANAWLDLRGDPPAVALSKLRSVATAFGPRLFLHPESRLFLSTGDLDPSTAATQLAAAIGATEPGQPPLISVIRGEHVLDRLEEWIQTERVPGLVERPAPSAAWVAPPPAPLRMAQATAATLIVGRWASAESIRAALSDDDSADPETVEVVLRRVTCYRTRLSPTESDLCKEPLEQITTRLQKIAMKLGSGCRIEYEKDSFALVASDRKQADLLATQVELALPTGSLRQPLTEAFAPTYDVQHVDIPATEVEFGVDTRPAADWG